MKIWTFFVAGAVSLWLAGCAGGRYVQHPNADYEKIALPAVEVTEVTPQAGIDSASTLDHLLTYAALNSPELQSAYARWQAGLERILQVTALPDPRLAYVYHISEVETRVGPQSQRFSASQTLPWFGKRRLQGGVAGREADVRRAAFDAARLRLFFSVKEAWFEYAYLVRSIEVFRENVQLLVLLEGAIRSGYRAGTAPHASLIRIQVELDRLRDRLRDVEDMERPLKARLNSALNRPPDRLLPRPREILTPQVELDDALLMERVSAMNPDLQAEESMIEMQALGIDLARRTFFPDVTVGLDYIVTTTTTTHEVVENGKDPVMAMISINLPLWWGKNRAAVREARARHASTIYQRDARRNGLAARLESVLYEFREAGRKIRLYRDSLIPRSRQAFNVTRAAFTAGQVDLLEMIDAQRTLLEFQLLLERARADYNQRLAELEMLTGAAINEKDSENE